MVKPQAHLPIYLGCSLGILCFIGLNCAGMKQSRLFDVHQWDSRNRNFCQNLVIARLTEATSPVIIHLPVNYIFDNYQIRYVSSLSPYETTVNDTASSIGYRVTKDASFNLTICFTNCQDCSGEFRYEAPLPKLRFINLVIRFILFTLVIGRNADVLHFCPFYLVFGSMSAFVSVACSCVAVYQSDPNLFLLPVFVFALYRAFLEGSSELFFPLSSASVLILSFISFFCCIYTMKYVWMPKFWSRMITFGYVAWGPDFMTSHLLLVFGSLMVLTRSLSMTYPFDSLYKKYREERPITELKPFTGMMAKEVGS